MIPAFDTDGNLPAGIHVVTWEVFSDRFGGTTHRRCLVDGFEQAIDLLRFAGCPRTYVDGSFVTAKVTPNDYDVAWETAGVDLPLLMSAEPLFFDFTNLRAAQKAKFGGEFFPADAAANTSGTVFLDFFQTDKDTGKQKGIIALDL